LPNLLALDFFLKEIWPLLQVASPTLHVIAGARHEFHHQRNKDRIGFLLDQAGMEVEGFVSDVRPAYRRAAIVIAPLLASAGTNIKIMEAMAMGKPIVSTPAGVNGLDVTPGTDVIVAREAPAFANAILELINDSGLQTALGSNARATAERIYNWDVIATEQDRLYRQLIRS
jgi:glycosyltransferase involved in cell wall biosynthesis